MTKWILGIVTTVAFTLAAFYVWLYRPQQDALEAARRDNALSAQESSALRSRIEDLEEMLAEAQQGSAALEARVQEREEQLAAIQATQDDLLKELEEEISEGQVQIERMRNELRLQMVEEILFDSGEAELKAEGKEILEKVAPVLERAQRRIEVQGHTDNVPIRGHLAQAYPTNWELSAARAVNVVRFLHEQAALDPESLSATALSEFRPRSDNGSEEGRARNRRIEILLAARVKGEASEPTDSSVATQGSSGETEAQARTPSREP